MFRAFFISIFFLYSLISSGQEIKPNASFQKDSVQIGESVPFSVWISYPRDLDVVFPDSLHDFSPFEIDRKQFFPTRSDSLLSSDSVVYHLSTFEIDSVQSLSLPIYLINEYDSTLIETPRDSVILEHLVVEIPDSVSLKVNTEYIEVPLEFNYPYLIIGISTGIIIIVIVLLVFGKTFKKQIALFRLRRRHKRFIKRFEAILLENSLNAEPTLVVWKKYMERLSKLPYRKLTSKEIFEIVQSDNLKSSLKIIDKIIYGGGSNEELKTSLEDLQAFAVEEFEKKTEEIKNG